MARRLAQTHPTPAAASDQLPLVDILEGSEAKDARDTADAMAYFKGVCIPSMFRAFEKITAIITIVLTSRLRICLSV